MNRSRIPAAIAVAAAALALTAGLAEPVLADEPVRGNILVPIEQVAPGDAFPVTGYELDPGITITMRINQAATSTELGSVTVAPDGTFQTSLTAPAPLSGGYAELIATSDEGSQWRASVLIAGPGDGNATPPPGAQSPASGAVDPRLLALAVMAVGLVIFAVAGLRYLRR